MIYAAKTTGGQESLVVEILQHKIKKEDLEVYCLGVVPKLKGYILIEAKDRLTAQRLISDVPHIKGRGLVSGEIKIEELTPLIEAKPLMLSLKEGEKIEIVSGPFKGEKARITRINPAKEEITVELLQATIKIPVTIKVENIRVIKD